MKTWFITGASRGFGRQVTIEALRRGDKVAATARQPGALDDLVAAYPDVLLPLTLDVTDQAAVVRAVSAAQQRFGAIDVLFNNAGIGYFAAVEESDDVEVRHMLEVNLFALANVTKAVLPGMRKRRSGTILNASSLAGTRAFQGVGWYCASKFAVEGLSEALEQEVAPLGIRVVLIEPSAFSTDWAGNSASEVAPADEIADYAATAGAQRRAIRRGAGSEPGDPAKAARIIVSVAHDPAPPRRLPLGNFAYDALLSKLDQVRIDIALREALSRSADRIG
ncbi:oxidoreductase [Burkholderia gladioli]|uniref:oxidoreductase n=1 Tax=Burkholderia gladioli TaxID=28095 RepID=UPI00164057DC|nr:oxidoreductase [Burkholderia gladioli]